MQSNTVLLKPFWRLLWSVYVKRVLGRFWCNLFIILEAAVSGAVELYCIIPEGKHFVQPHWYKWSFTRVMKMLWFPITWLHGHSILITLSTVFDIKKSAAVHGSFCSFHFISTHTKPRGRVQRKFTEWELNKHGITAAEQSEIVLPCFVKSANILPSPLHMTV